MGLTLVGGLAGLAMAALALGARGMRRGAAFFRLAAILSALAALAQAAGYALAAERGGIALVLLRLSAASTLAAYLAYLRVSLGYPYARRLVAVDAVLLAAALGGAWFCLGTQAYIESVRRVGPDLIRFEGSGHGLYLLLGALVGGSALAVTLAKALAQRNRMFRQHLFLMAAGLSASIAWGYLLTRYAVSGPLASAYPLSAIGLLGAALAGAYAYSSTRPFLASQALKAAGAWAVVALAFGAPAGIIAALAFIFVGQAPVVTAAVTLLAFVAFGRAAEAFARGRLGAERDEAAREALEAAIAHLDLSEGRGATLARLSAVMTEALGASWLQSLSEDEAGGLRRTFPDDGTLVLAAGSQALEALAALDRRVVLQSDVMADEAFAEHRDTLLGFLGDLGAEALVLAKEGRRVIGAFALGPKRSGADYDALDYATLDAAHGKLFVVAYYARHVERESLLETVEKEIGLADQIVRSIQERVDPIAHPGVGVAFRCRSSRGLGGDLFDSVRLSEHRWFFVVGDVSGKGLNASMSMIILKSMIRTLLAEEKDFTRLVSRINAFIKERLPRGTFFSGLFGFLALDKGSVYFINCGIPAMLFGSPALDSVMEAQGEGRMLGFVRNVEPYLKTKKLALPPGSRLLICTDGIVEAESVRGERYGKERLARILAENKASGAEETVEAVIRSATAFAGGRLDDDITVVAIDYEGPAKERKR